MLTRRKVRRIACWVGVGIGAASLPAFALSLLGSPVLGGPGSSIGVGRGALALFSRPRALVSPRDPVLNAFDQEGAWCGVFPSWGEYSPARGYGRIVVPLWMPIGLGLVCFYLLLPERTPWHSCECGYDLRAVPARDGRTVCPECGRATGPVSERRDV